MSVRRAYAQVVAQGSTRPLRVARADLGNRETVGRLTSPASKDAQRHAGQATARHRTQPPRRNSFSPPSARPSSAALETLREAFQQVLLFQARLAAGNMAYSVSGRGTEGGASLSGTMLSWRRCRGDPSRVNRFASLPRKSSCCRHCRTYFERLGLSESAVPETVAEAEA